MHCIWSLHAWLLPSFLCKTYQISTHLAGAVYITFGLKKVGVPIREKWNVKMGRVSCPLSIQLLDIMAERRELS